jgi:sensor histidine kinase YesM
VLWSAQDLAEGGPFSAAYKLLLLRVLGTGLLLSGLLAVVVWLCHRAPRGRKMAVIIVAASASALAHGVIDAYQVRQYMDAVGAARQPISELFNRGLMPFVFIYGFYALAWGLRLSEMAVRESQRRLAEANSAAQQAQLAALRFQLNPHFLFNTLNALSSLIVTNRNEDAEHVTMKLAEFLRLTLEADPEQEVTLDEELATTQSYLEIETARFGDRLHVEIDCPSDLLGAHVPSFLLQPLAENAVKYAVAPSRTPVTLSIHANEVAGMLQLVVKDDGRHVFGAPPPAGLGVGLANVRKRLEAFYQELGHIEARATERGFIVTLTLPLRIAAISRAAE